MAVRHLPEVGSDQPLRFGTVRHGAPPSASKLRADRRAIDIMSDVRFDRVSVDHQVMGGVPCIRGTRIPVATVVGMVAEGMTTEEILAEFSQLDGGDIRDALRYAAAAVDERELPVSRSG